MEMIRRGLLTEAMYSYFYMEATCCWVDVKTFMINANYLKIQQLSEHHGLYVPSTERVSAWSSPSNFYAGSFHKSESTRLFNGYSDLRNVEIVEQYCTDLCC